MIELPPFPPGDYYDCNESERLTHESPEEAIEFAVEDWYEAGRSMADVIRAHGPLRVTSYTPKVVPEEWIADLAEMLLEKADERWGEEFCASDNDGDYGPGPEHFEAIQTKLTPLLVEFFKDSTPYDCVEVGHVDLTPEQVEAIMRKARPDWFEEGR